jgi:hypothetical protein
MIGIHNDTMVFWMNDKKFFSGTVVLEIIIKNLQWYIIWYKSVILRSFKILVPG